MLCGFGSRANQKLLKPALRGETALK